MLDLVFLVEARLGRAGLAAFGVSISKAGWSAVEGSGTSEGTAGCVCVFGDSNWERSGAGEEILSEDEGRESIRYCGGLC